MAMFASIYERETIPAPPSKDQSSSKIAVRTKVVPPSKLPLRLSLVLVCIDDATDVAHLVDGAGFAREEVYAALLDLEALGLVSLRSR